MQLWKRQTAALEELISPTFLDFGAWCDMWSYRRDVLTYLAQHCDATLLEALDVALEVL